MRQAGPSPHGKRPHLAIYLSAHGFGHIGQTAPVARELLQRTPELELTLVSAAPAFKLRERFGTGAAIHAADLDVGMRQSNALEVDIRGSWEAYTLFHDSWQNRVAQEAARLRQLAPDLVLANVPYLPLAAAKRAGIPAVAMCSLDWASIFGHYFASAGPDAAAILDEMLDAYRYAIRFLRLEPALAMPHLENGMALGPVAESGADRRAEIASRVGLDKDELLVMVSLGGMEFRPPVEQWPRVIGAHLIVPASWEAEHPDLTAFEELGIPFIDALASCDLLIAKPGYGSFVEAACNGLPVLYVERRNWPEAGDIVSWMQGHGTCAKLEAARLDGGQLIEPIRSLLAQPKRAPVKATGAAEAAVFLADRLEN